MKRLFALSVLLALALVSLPSIAWIRSPATTFATLPAGATPPEGIAVDASGNVYVSTFGFPEPPAVSTDPGRIVVFDSHGKLLRQLIVTGASPHLLGLGVHPSTQALLVADFGAGKVLSVDPMSGASQVFTDIGPTSGLNALTFDSAGNVYISDSFQGIIWRTGPAGGAAVAWASRSASFDHRRASVRRQRTRVQQQRHAALRRQYRKRLGGENSGIGRRGGSGLGAGVQHQRRRWCSRRRQRQHLGRRQPVRRDRRSRSDRQGNRQAGRLRRHRRQGRGARLAVSRPAWCSAASRYWSPIWCSTWKRSSVCRRSIRSGRRK